MSTDARWPRLKLGVHPVLDWVGVQYTSASLLEMADAIAKNPHPIHTKTATGAPAVWDTALEALLRSLADNTKAVDALNHHRPTPPSEVVGLNRAVHFHVQAEIEGAGTDKTKKARGIVADTWGVSDGHVKDDVAKFRIDNGDGCVFRDGLHDARHVMKQVIALACARTGKSRTEVLNDFSQDMRDRAEPYRSK